MVAQTPVTVHVAAAAVRMVVPPLPEPGPAAADVAMLEAERAEVEHAAVTDEAPGPRAADAQAAAAPVPAMGARPRARFEPLRRIDRAAYFRVNRIPHSRRLERLMTAVSDAMLHGEAWVLASVLLASWRRDLGWRLLATVVPGVWLAQLAVNYGLKGIFRRKRPFVRHVDARVLGHRPLDSSFPSGHAAGAFAGAVLLGVFVPAWSPLLFAFAVLVGYSRVYLGVHYPSDVAVGALAGVLLAPAYASLLRAILGG